MNTPVEPQHDDLAGPRAWSESDRLVPRAFVQPVLRFTSTEASGGFILLAAAVTALVWANSPWHGSYESLWHTDVVVRLGESLAVDHLDLREWVNDGLMALFFLLVGLEVKRELVLGELRDPRAAALPLVAAVGGMAVPALLYTLINAGGDGASGWGIPVATDIAFAVGIVALAGPRVPTGAKLFLLTLAVADDIGGVIVIAVFYSDTLAPGWLAVALGGLGGAWLLRRGDVRSLVPYLAVGVLVWVALLESGVHATLAGVALGLMCPTRSFFDPARFAPRARHLVDLVERSHADGLTAEERSRNESALADMVRLASETESPLERVERRLSPWVALGVLPVFALANAGVRVSGDALGAPSASRVALGVGVGLVVGKTVGVYAATWAAVRAGIGRLPAGTTWQHVLGLAATAGVGFTVALFLAGLSFDDPRLVDAAKVGILAGSLVAGVAGFLLLRRGPRPATPA